ncbi:hypothetical protein KS4_36200 [Poriferisphaera corsica]|uniref:Uncharacterized protein n=1 Tax=Poriferisphaera corsica TaxID=2528020 RepID=A0A517YZ83_9BACT|nr:hypothetical protein KS4_36200 [Poriferisphaera corsica]
MEERGDDEDEEKEGGKDGGAGFEECGGGAEDGVGVLVEEEALDAEVGKADGGE